MNISETMIKGIYVIEPEIYEDERGFLFECFSEKKLMEVGIAFKCVQENHICSIKKGVLRGIHFQNHPYAQAKFLRCLRGSVLDYAIDLRKNSPTYMQYVSKEISKENKKIIFIPKGFGHAIVSLTDISEIQYKTDNFYSPKHDRSIRYDDEQLNIQWPFKEVILSEKDKTAPRLGESDCNF